MRVKERIKQVFFKDCDQPLWVPVGVAEGESTVCLTLHGLSTPRDVTQHSVIVSLRPLLFGIGWETAVDLADLQAASLSLRITDDVQDGRELAHVQIRAVEVLPRDGGGALAICRPAGHRNLCLPPSRVTAQRIFDRYSAWRNRNNRSPYNFDLAPRDLECMCLFYIRPRPVVLVSVVDDGARASVPRRGNIFPMDLIGPVGASRFALALRSTSAPVDLIKATRRVALSSVPMEQVGIAYDFGAHHRKESIDWDALPMSMTRSAQFGLPVPCFALQVREMQVDSFHVVGSHTLFMTLAVGEESKPHPNPLLGKEREQEDTLVGWLRLCHVPGFVQMHRQRCGQAPYPEASSAD